MAGTVRDNTTANAKRAMPKDTRGTKRMSVAEAVCCAASGAASVKSRAGWQLAATRVATMRKTFGFVPRVFGETQPEGYTAAVAESGALVWRPTVHDTHVG
jgi:hypothetical protein